MGLIMGLIMGLSGWCSDELSYFSEGLTPPTRYVCMYVCMYIYIIGDVHNDMFVRSILFVLLHACIFFCHPFVA